MWRGVALRMCASTSSSVSASSLGSWFARCLRWASTSGSPSSSLRISSDIAPPSEFSTPFGAVLSPDGPVGRNLPQHRGLRARTTKKPGRGRALRVASSRCGAGWPCECAPRPRRRSRPRRSAPGSRDACGGPRPRAPRPRPCESRPTLLLLRNSRRRSALSFHQTGQWVEIFHSTADSGLGPRKSPAGAGPFAYRVLDVARGGLANVRLDLVVGLGLVARLLVREMPAVGLDLGLLVLPLLVRHCSSFEFSTPEWALSSHQTGHWVEIFHSTADSGLGPRKSPAGAGPFASRVLDVARGGLANVRLDLVVGLGLVARLLVREMPAVGLDLGLPVLVLANLVRHCSSFGILDAVRRCPFTRRASGSKSSTAPRTPGSDHEKARPGPGPSRREF